MNNIETAIAPIYSSKTGNPHFISTEERLIRLKTWEFDRVVAKLVKTKQANDENEAIEMVEEYKRYIELYIRNGVNMPMSVPVDPAWHTHILFTQDYEKFCKEVIGHFLHHEPTITDEDVAALADRYKNITIALYENQFGSVSEKWWPQNKQICEPPGCSAGCGNAIN